MRCTAVVVVALGWMMHASGAAALCPGDCNADGTVAIAELVATINVALGATPLSSCPAGDVNGDGAVSVAETVTAVQAALDGCGLGARCPVTRVASSNGVAALAGPGLSVAANGDFDVVTGSTQLIDGAPARAVGSVVVHRCSGGALQNEVELAAPTQVVLAPRLAGLADGGGAVAWGEADPRAFGSPISRLLVRRYGSRGTPLGNVITVTKAQPRHQLSLATVAANGSDALLSWMDREETSQGATAFRGALRRQSSKGLDATRAVGCFGDPVSIPLADGLGVVCVAFDVDPMQVVLRAFTLDGSDVTPRFDFRTVGPYGAIGAAADSQRIAVAWHEPLDTPLRTSRVLAQTAGLDGTPLIGPLVVGTVVDTQVPPAIALLRDGSIAVAYGESPLQVSRFAADGTPLGDPVVVDNTRVDELALGADSGGDLIVAWRWRDVFALRIPALGSSACQ
jgi:hypothetical protein